MPHARSHGSPSGRLRVVAGAGRHRARRRTIVLHLDEGQLYLTTPLAGRTVAAVFVGRGSVSFTHPWWSSAPS
jgi:hypothetical protein